MKRYIFLAFVFISVLMSAQLSYAFRWERITNIPVIYANNYWLDIYFHPTNTNYGWACGFNGMVLRTTDGGKNWAGSQINGAYHLESIHFPTLKTGYTSGVDGIFKTIDGGATWFNITPLNNSELWGCFFLNENWGLVVGDGCVGNQSFYHTTDGGNSWNLFELHEPASGMTDLMLYPNGLGYASGSGIIYKTLDSGQTWSVYRNTGAKYWQEEITNYNNSFLVPTSGNTCMGGGVIGGMRFSADDGNNWNQFITPNSMFGSFLIDANKGWVCGYTRLVYYTSNAGNTWQTRNCGIEAGNLDDIWFNSPTDGWVVGQGIWKLAPSVLALSDSLLNFATVCVPYTKRDSIYLVNKSFDDAVIDVTITGLNASDFTLIEPNALQFNMSTCDSLLLIVEFAPTSIGWKTANLNLSYNGTPYYCLLNGRASESTIKLSADSVYLGSILCAKDYIANAEWTANQTESVRGFLRLINDTDINLATNLPQSISNGSGTTLFRVNALDTGWVYEKFMLATEPCSQEHFFSIAAYAVSPIINSQSVDISKKCYIDSIVSVPISNTGNDTLKISAIHLSDSTNWSVIGWRKNTTLDAKIGVRQTDTLLLGFHGVNSGRYNLVINIENNDSTKFRGNKNPFKAYISQDLDKTDIYPKIVDVDFGDVCLNQDSSIVVGFSNKGSVTADLQSITNSTPAITVSTISGSGNDSLKYRLKFSPASLGKFSDTVCITLTPCIDKLYVRAVGNSVGGNITATPASIIKMLQKGIEADFLIDLKSNANIPANIKSISIAPPQKDMIVTFDKQTPFVLGAGSTENIGLKIKATNDTIVSFRICFETDTKCLEDICIPVDITSTSRLIAVSKSECTFDTIVCSPITSFDTVYVKNLGISPDTLTNISLSGSSCFNLFEKPNLPYFVQPGDSVRIVVSYLPLAEETATASIIISSKEPDGQNLTVLLRGVFAKSIISMDKLIYDFGRFEYCEDNIIREIKLFNTGTLGDSVSISIENNPVISLLPQRVFVKAMDSTVVILSLTVANAINTGKFEYDIAAVSDKCGKTTTAKAIGEFIRPELIINPAILNFGTHWIGRNATLNAVLTNISQDSISIIAIEPIGVSNFALSNSRNNFAAGDTGLVSAIFKSESVGNYESEYRIIYKSKCADTLLLKITATTPEEAYWANLRIGDYTANVRDTVDVCMSLDTALPNFGYTGAKFSIDFERKLLYPLDLKVWNGNEFVSHDFAETDKGLKFALESDLANSVLTKQGDIALIPCIALASLPTYTDIVISEFVPGTTKTINYTKDDGSFQLKEFCYAEYFGGFVIISSVTSNRTAYTGEAVRINAVADGAIGTNVEIYNYLGDVVYSQRYALSKGENTIEIPITAYGQGYYILRMKSDINQQWVEKLMIVR